MSIKGFTVEGQDYQYNYPNLDNIPEITPESIGAASQDEVNALKSESYNLIDPTGITPYQSTSAADLTRTGFVIRNTAEATYSRGYLYLNLKPNTEYTFSAKKHTTSGVGFVGYAEAPAEGEAYPSANISLISRTAPDDETITKTFTTTTGILVIRFYATWDTAELGEVEYSEIMVVEGAEEKPYVRHVFAQDDEARNAINDLQTGLDQKAGILRNTASGAIVSFMPDASVKDLLGLTVAVEPVQDLHGYDNPWPAGAMGNLLPLSGNMTKTNNGVSATLENGIITLSGTASGNAVIVFDLETAISILPENYKIALFNSANSSSVFFRTQDGSTSLHNFACSPVNRVVASWTAQGAEHTTAVGVQVSDGVNVDGMSLKPMVVPLIESDPSAFYPYSNICPISGWDGVTVNRTGVNWYPVSIGADYWENFKNGSSSNNNGELIVSMAAQMYSGVYSRPDAQIRKLSKYSVTASYSVNIKASAATEIYIGYARNGNREVQLTTEYQRFTFENFAFGTEDTFNIYNGTANAVTVYLKDFQLELGSTVTAYEPYQGNTYSITFPTEAGTVYGGTLDVTTGRLKVDRAMVDLGTMGWGYESSSAQFYSNGIAGTSINWDNWSNTPPLLCSRYKPISNALLASTDFCVGYAYNSKQLRVKDSGFTDAATFRTDMSGVQLCYELATPIVYDLTPQTIETIKCQINNVWADAGDVTVEFAEDIKTYIDNKFAELQALALENS